MTFEQKQRWSALITAAQSELAKGGESLPAPMDLLLAVDLEVCALQSLCASRRPLVIPNQVEPTPASEWEDQRSRLLR